MKRIMTLLMFAFAAITLANCSTVSTGYRGVVLNFSKPTGEVKSEGLFWYNPVSTSIVPMNVQTVADEITASASSVDLQVVTTKMVLNYHLAPDKVSNVYDQFREDYESRIINPAVQEATKSGTAHFKAADLIAHRDEVRQLIENQLKQRLAGFGIVIDQVNIIDFKFTDQFQQAVEDKVAASQAYATALIQAKTTVTQAQAAADSQRLQKQSLTPDLVTLKMLEKWDGHFPQVMGNSNPFVQLTQPNAK